MKTLFVYLSVWLVHFFAISAKIYLRKLTLLRILRKDKNKNCSTLITISCHTREPYTKLIFGDMTLFFENMTFAVMTVHRLSVYESRPYFGSLL